MNTPSLSYEVAADGTVTATIIGALPQPSIVENAKWKWVPWNVNYQKQQLEKDGARVLQSIANLKLVETTLASRVAQREEEKATKALAASAAASHPAQTVVAEVPTAAPSQTPAPKRAKATKRSARRN